MAGFGGDRELGLTACPVGTVGLGWTRGDYEKAFGANLVGPFNAVHDDFALTTSYKLRPGISVDGLVEFSAYKGNNAAGPDYQGVGAAIGHEH